MNSAPPKITALVHTRNESAWLAGCLETLQWADELIVADMTSTDDTPGNRHPPGGHESSTCLCIRMVEPVRNLALSQCTHDWVLIVDADERVPALPRRTPCAPWRRRPRASAIGLPRKNFFLGEWMEHGFWPDHQVRFVRRKQIHWPSLWCTNPPKVDGQQINLEANPAWALEHPGYGASLGRFIQKFVHYSRLDAERQAATVKPTLWPYLIRRPASEFLGPGTWDSRPGVTACTGWSESLLLSDLPIARRLSLIGICNGPPRPFRPAETLRRAKTRNELGRTLSEVVSHLSHPCVGFAVCLRHCGTLPP